MIYLVTTQQELFNNNEYTIILAKESLNIIESWKIIQVDSETNGKDPHLKDFLCVQLGNKKAGIQLVIDTSTINIKIYKNKLENTLCVLQNGKFDLQFFFNYGIIIRNIYDTMVIEQFLHLGYSAGLTFTPEEYYKRECTFPYKINKDKKTGRITYTLSYSLNAIARNRLGIDIDKTIRGQIIRRGLDTSVIKYAAGDVMYLEDIMWSQVADLKRIPNALIGARIECLFVPVVAYLEWCGIKLDKVKWIQKMQRDKQNLDISIKALNDFVLRTPILKDTFTYINRQGDLFNGWDLEPKVTINWNSPDVIKVAKILGFNTIIQDKKTGENKESAMEKHLRSQKGINDEFLRLYFGEGEEGDEDYFPGYSRSFKVCTSFGQGHLDAINPKTGRLHTIYRSIGTISGRMSSGSSKECNTDLARYKGISEQNCKYPNMQQLPHDELTRACFIAEKGNLFCSCDYAAMEARIGADVYNEKMLLDEFLYRSGDTHAAYAKVVFAEELKDIPVEKIKKKRPDLRSKVKSVEFAVQFGSDGSAVAPQLKIPVEEAKQLVQNLLNGMTGLKAFKEKSSRFVMQNGYVEILPQTGHRGYWYDWNYWKKVQASYDSKFWDKYKIYHKGTGDKIDLEVKEHFKAKSKWCDRMSLNLPTQGGGAVALKDFCISWFNWVVDNGYFGKILLVNLTHDECNSEFPEELKDTYPKMVADMMEAACAKYYHKLPIPAEPAVGTHWIH